MLQHNKEVLIVFDDREFTNEEIKPFVGMRRYGDIIYRRRKISDYFAQNLPEWASHNFHRLRNSHDLSLLRQKMENIDKDAAVFIMASRAGITSDEHLKQLIARLPYAEDNFSDRRHKPLVTFFKSNSWLLEHWENFAAQPLHTMENPWKDMERVSTLDILDLGKIHDFLSFMRGSTETRHFNEVHIDKYYYTKISTDKRKLKAEYNFYNLAPEKIRPWLIQPFEFKEMDAKASYKMVRHYLADAALLWIHDAFDYNAFEAFIERMLFFLSERPRKNCDEKAASTAAHDLFIEKVIERSHQFLALKKGGEVNNLVAGVDTALDIHNQIERYKKLYARYQRYFVTDHLVVGHGDPCFSNILYDQQRYLMKLIDPKGAIEESDLWMHPLYDLCKISHSVLGDYDFINNGLYEICLDNENKMSLRIEGNNRSLLQTLFRNKLSEHGFDWKAVRLGEASLFLSMLPLHIDHPNKITAFMLTAKKILDEIEHD